MATVAVAILAIFTLAGCTSDSKPEPDRVVNVVWKCESVSPADFKTYRPMIGEQCRQWAGDELAARNPHLEVTVRTALGTTYTFDLPKEATVTLGQIWPPN